MSTTFLWNARFKDRRGDVEAQAFSAGNGEWVMFVAGDAVSGHHISFRVTRAKALELARMINMAFGRDEPAIDGVDVA